MKPSPKKQVRRPSAYRAPMSSREVAARVIERAKAGKAAILRDEHGKVIGVVDGGVR